MVYDIPVDTKLGSKIFPVKPDGAVVVNTPPLGLPTKVTGAELVQ
jgi:hypothetical protein